MNRGFLHTGNDSVEGIVIMNPAEGMGNEGEALVYPGSLFGFRRGEYHRGHPWRQLVIDEV